jgi:NAD(P)H-nitrite reductase large subunit
MKPKIYRKMVIQNDVLEGAILLGIYAAVNKIQHAIKKEIRITAIKKELAYENFDFNQVKTSSPITILK